MQVLTLKFDDHPEELYFTYDSGTVSMASETRSIGSVFVGVLEPEFVDVVETEPIPDDVDEPT